VVPNGCLAFELNLMVVLCSFQGHNTHVLFYIYQKFNIRANCEKHSTAMPQSLVKSQKSDDESPEGGAKCQRMSLKLAFAWQVGKLIMSST
jgi:hypothetical protein